MNTRIQLLEYLVAALRVPMQSADAAVRRVAAEYGRTFSAEIQRLKHRGGETPASPDPDAGMTVPTVAADQK